MAEMAKVAVLTEPRTFEYREVAIPEIGPDDGILRVEAAGLCGTDWEQYLGHLDNTPWAVRPIIPGHEILGWIDKVGPEAAKRWDVKEGDRVSSGQKIALMGQTNAGEVLLHFEIRKNGTPVNPVNYLPRS